MLRTERRPHLAGWPWPVIYPFKCLLPHSSGGGGLQALHVAVTAEVLGFLMRVLGILGPIIVHPFCSIGSHHTSVASPIS